jgi:hypothetical protein
MRYYGFLLNTIATLAIWVLRRWAWFYSLITIKDDNKYNSDLSLVKDRYLNVLLAPITNQLLITKDGYQFGNGKETMSSVIGKNYLQSTLTKKGFSNGLWWFNYLEKTDKKPNHCIRAIDYNI